MAKTLHALFVHGIGEQKPDFASYAITHLGKALAEQDTTLYARSVHWAPMLDGIERGFSSRVAAHGSKMNPSQKLAVGTLADALAYRSDAAVGRKIHDLVDDEIVRLRADNIVIFAHSLGGLVMLDYLRSRTNVRPAKFCTFGCNIGLFGLGTKINVPSSVGTPGTWLNFFDSADFLGYPLQASPELAHVQDILVDVGNIFTRWNGLSHLGYFKDRSFWRKDVPRALRGVK